MSRFTVALALGGLLCAQPSQADPVVVTRGGLSIDFLGGDNSFGFGTDASPFLFGGVLMDSYVLVVPPGSALGCTRSAPCFANDRLSLSGTESGSGFAIVGLDSLSGRSRASFQFTSKGALLDGESGSIGIPPESVRVHRVAADLLGLLFWPDRVGDRVDRPRNGPPVVLSAR